MSWAYEWDAGVSVYLCATLCSNIVSGSVSVCVSAQIEIKWRGKMILLRKKWGDYSVLSFCEYIRISKKLFFFRFVSSKTGEKKEYGIKYIIIKQSSVRLFIGWPDK